MPHAPWQDISMDFVLVLPKTNKQHDSILLVVDRFSKKANFVTCSKTSDASHVAQIFLERIIVFMVSQKQLSDRDVKLTTYFWKTLWQILGTKLQFSPAYHP